MSERQVISRSRLFVGAAVLIIGFCGPLFIPFITNSGLSMGLKTTLTGLLAFGIPEVFMLIAVAIMGKAGYESIKEKALKYFQRFAPPDKVSLARYRIGLALFIIPLLLGWLQPYLGHYFTTLDEVPLWTYILGDMLFISSFFVLGGNFWDKLSGLFKFSN